MDVLPSTQSASTKLCSISPVVRVKVSELRPHPKQHVYFSDVPQHEVDELVADMSRNGQRYPVDILPDGTIVCGHRRLQAAEILNWTEIDAIILDIIDEAEIERRLIEDNLSRRQLGPVGLARIYKALKETERRRGGAGNDGDLRDRLAKRLGIRSGRTLDRNLRILEAPREVQDAVESRLISRSTAERVLLLTKANRERLAAEIRAGADAKKVVARFLPDRGEDELVLVRRTYRNLLLTMRKSVHALGDRVKDIAGHGMEAEDAIPLLKEFARFSEKLLKAEEQAQKKFDRKLARLLNNMTGRTPTRRRACRTK
jgi:ParB/RepB/Spo0J family partition protein